jgi:hypothetical protein
LGSDRTFPPGRKRRSTHQNPENFKVEQLPPEVTAKLQKAPAKAKEMEVAS